jgi:hypothetical protein
VEVEVELETLLLVDQHDQQMEQILEVEVDLV